MSGTTMPLSLAATTPSHGETSSKVITAIVAVMKEVKEIPKGGYNKDGKYEYVMVADLWAKLQDAQAKAGLVVSQRQVSMKIESKILCVLYTFDAYHESGEVIYNIASHTGAVRFEFKSGATDDKSFSKCLVSASKYAMLGLFRIPPDDHGVERLSDGDADSQGPNDDAPSDREERRARPSDDDPPPPAEDALRAPEWNIPPPQPPQDDERGPTWTAPRNPGDTVNPTDTGFIKRVQGFKDRLDHAQNYEDACLLWRDEHELVRQMAENTYEHLRRGFHARWQAYPPAV